MSSILFVRFSLISANVLEITYARVNACSDSKLFAGEGELSPLAFGSTQVVAWGRSGTVLDDVKLPSSRLTMSHELRSTLTLGPIILG